jgi:hypothetical protein
MKKDPIKNVDMWRDAKRKPDIEKDYGFMKNILPAGTATHTYQTGKVLNGKLDRTNITIEKAPRNKTDHVSFIPPENKAGSTKESDMEMTAPRYGKNHRATY